jgi:hypothetical protein
MQAVPRDVRLHSAARDATPLKLLKQLFERGGLTGYDS